MKNAQTPESAISIIKLEHDTCRIETLQVTFPNHLNDNLTNELVEKLNETLAMYPDKDWNYSRILLVYNKLVEFTRPYCLWCDLVDRRTEDGKLSIKRTKEEIAWGQRHMNELGILEIVSCRINKALSEVACQDYRGNFYPILRVESTKQLRERGIEVCLWYRVQEIVGDDFDTR